MDSPTAWNVNDKFDYLGVYSDGLRVDYTGEDIGTIGTRNNLKSACNLLAYYNSFKYKGLDENNRNTAAATIRSNYPIPPQCKLFYFEVEIIDKGKRGYVRFFFFFVLHKNNIFDG